MVLNATTTRQIDDNIKTDLTLKEGYDHIPKTIIPSIQPVYEVYRRVCNVSRSVAQTTTGTFTIFTANADRDIFLTGVTLSYVKGATCDIGTGSIDMTATVKGVATNLLSLAVLTLTAQSDSMTLSFPTPIQVDRNTAVTVTGTFTAGALSRTACVHGYSNSPLQPPFLSMN